MRTTLNIDDDVLAAARSIAEQTQMTIGQVITLLARKSLQPARNISKRNGIPLLPVIQQMEPVTLDRVNQLRDGDLEP